MITHSQGHGQNWDHYNQNYAEKEEREAKDPWNADPDACCMMSTV